MSMHGFGLALVLGGVVLSLLGGWTMWAQPAQLEHLLVLKEEVIQAQRQIIASKEKSIQFKHQTIAAQEKSIELLKRATR